MIGVTTFGGDGGKSGISQYIIHLLTEFEKIQSNEQFEILTYQDEKRIYLPASQNFSILRFPSSFRNPMLNVAWHQLVLPYWCKKQDYDVLFLPSANRRLPLWAPCPTVGTVHDFSSIHVQGKYDPARMFYIKKVLPLLIRKLNKVITVSESSKKDIVEFAQVSGDKIIVTPEAADQSVYFPRDKEESQVLLAQKYKIRSPYICYVSRLEYPGKNHVRLIEAFKLLKQTEKIPHQLVLAGSDWSGAEEVHQAAEKSGFSKDILFTGFFPAADLPYLYSGCDLFVFPSLYEGFGLPILEAMSCKSPVICSNISSMPEVAGPEALLFDPYSVESIAQATLRLLADDSYREIYANQNYQRSLSFTWEKTARQTLQVLQEAAKEKKAVTNKHSIPVPEYSSDQKERIALLEELERRYEKKGFTKNLRFWWKKYSWRLATGAARFIKRGIDIFVSLTLLLMLCPFFVLIGLLIRCTDGGPVLFWQIRVAQWGREFPFPKFRSMYMDAEERRLALLEFNDNKDSLTFKMKKDPRVTWIGRYLRKLSIDELPQLWCVLKGDMSLVGPRPPLPSEVAKYTLSDRRRLDVVPGLTCIWQVKGRGDIPFDKQVILDVQYIESQSIWLDIKILLQTIPAVLLGKGAY